MKSLIYTVSLPLAALLGFAVHRASLCTVRTIAEIFSTRKAYMIGGTLMGAGAVLIPGGNDTLILKSLPGLSPHAIPAFVALLFGIGVTLLFIRLLTGKTLKVVCTNDICQIENFSSLGRFQNKPKKLPL